MFLYISVIHRIAFWVVAFIFSSLVQAASWILPPTDVDLFGQIKTIPANRDETLLDVARRFGMGQDEMMLANPTVDRWLPEEGAEIILPTRYIIPQADRVGFIINLPEMRLYYFPKPIKGKKPVVITHPISIGRMDWRTPLGKTSVVRKQKILLGFLLSQLKMKRLQQVTHHRPPLCFQDPIIHWVVTQSI